jgi:hypothetical protein
MTGLAAGQPNVQDPHAPARLLLRKLLGRRPRRGAQRQLYQHALAAWGVGESGE